VFSLECRRPFLELKIFHGALKIKNKLFQKTTLNVLFSKYKRKILGSATGLNESG